MLVEKLALHEKTNPHGKACRACWLGWMDYQAAWDLQRKLVEERGVGLIPDTLLLLEHPPTYTLGCRGNEAHLLVDRETLTRQGIKVYRTDRGGDITFHGPDQLVGYPVLDLSGRRGGIARYLRDLEVALTRALAAFGIRGERLRGCTGVWVNNEKIAAIGVKVSARGVTSHGFALNVNTDLDYFSQIIPCGIHDRGVTSMARILGQPTALIDVAHCVMQAFGEVFGMEVVFMDQNMGANESLINPT